jgi:hypothetical protein
MPALAPLLNRYTDGTNQRAARRQLRPKLLGHELLPETALSNVGSGVHGRVTDEILSTKTMQ